jgi:predicted  nucleic acid-binding Zn-ribbon protein
VLEEPFKELEEKVRRTAEAVRSLRKENESLKKALNQANAFRMKRSTDDDRELASLRKTRASMEKELGDLQKEKGEVRTRVTGLLRQLDELNLG